MRARNLTGIASALGTAAATGGAYLRFRHDLRSRFGLSHDAAVPVSSKAQITATIPA